MPPIAAELANALGVLFVAGLVGVDEDGIESDGLEPVSVDSLGLRDQENISAPGIFQPLLHPVCVVEITTTTIPKRIQFENLFRMANNSF